jgi:hypothetical protein
MLAATSGQADACAWLGDAANASLRLVDGKGVARVVDYLVSQR